MAPILQMGEFYVNVSFGGTGRTIVAMSAEGTFSRNDTDIRKAWSVNNKGPDWKG